MLKKSFIDNQYKSSLFFFVWKQNIQKYVYEKAIIHYGRAWNSLSFDEFSSSSACLYYRKSQKLQRPFWLSWKDHKRIIQKLIQKVIICSGCRWKVFSVLWNLSLIICTPNTMWRYKMIEKFTRFQNLWLYLGKHSVFIMQISKNYVVKGFCNTKTFTVCTNVSFA